MRYSVFFYLKIILILSIAGCSTAHKPDIATNSVNDTTISMIRLEPDKFPTFDLSDTETLKEAINRDLQYLNRLDKETQYNYGKDVYTTTQVINSLLEFIELIDLYSIDTEKFNLEIKKRFNVYRSVGSDGQGKTLFTGYYVPTLKGSLTKSADFPYPLYSLPNDLIQISLGAFSDKYTGQMIVARFNDGKIVPYYTHKDILQGALENRGLELIWVDDKMKLFFLQVQGSGVIKLEDGSEIYVGYAGSNGHIYKSIGRYFVEKGYIKMEDISMQSILIYLKTHPDVINDALFYNPSYVFFQKTKDLAIGSIGVPLVNMRAIATDHKVFPKGALAYIQTSKPQCNEKGQIIEWNEFSRFVLNQDTGGAVKGTGHVDFFWGTGDYAEIAAGNLKHTGSLYFLIKK